MAPSTFIVPFQDSWFERNTTHHVGLPPDLLSVVQKWVREHVPGRQKSSARVEIFADGMAAGTGALNLTTGYLTGIKKMFKIMGIAEGNTETPALVARLSMTSDSLRVSFGRLQDDETQSESIREKSPLLPFSEKSEESYLIDLESAQQERGRNHELLVNGFARWLAAIGYAPQYSKAIDLALLQPPLIVEAKFIAPGKWTECVRGAVAQLVEYRWFSPTLRNANLIFLASEPVPKHWAEYLRKCHGIRSAWPEAGTYHVEELDIILPPITVRQPKSHEEKSS